MSAAARAEARRKAILSRGGDRLAKLTTSARGEDAPAYLHDDPPVPNLPSTSTSNFLGEESSDMPSLRSRSSHHSSPSPGTSPSPQPARTTGTNLPRDANVFDGLAANAPDPSVWSSEQQQQFIQALMNASGGPGGAFPPLPAAADPNVPHDPSMTPLDNPFAALMGAQGLGGAAGSGGAGMFPPFGPGMGMEGMGAGFPGAMAPPPKEKTKLQKVLPLLHLVAMWCLLAYFVLWGEPSVHREITGEDVAWNATGIWKRWSALGQRSPLLSTSMETFKVHVVPFFWAFTTLQIALHSLRIFAGFDSVQPPTLLALVLPHLPPPLPSLIINSMKYMQMGSLFLDDLSGLVVGVGFIIYFSGWIAQT
ncbi:hypothetical protein BDN70DRAFT_991181 [Pholiota conissans]|uniref:Uncharacterized protein n=1 Tax=Pholiota conissans TaxID=109636 RepID=A0A9P5Z779_9AGAR|nr:hypothetical protein BDN70DRAFT_991181 [Pholiota conissans]